MVFIGYGLLGVNGDEVLAAREQKAVAVGERQEGQRRIGAIDFEPRRLAIHQSHGAGGTVV